MASGSVGILGLSDFPVPKELGWRAPSWASMRSYIVVLESAGFDLCSSISDVDEQASIVSIVAKDAA